MIFVDTNYFLRYIVRPVTTDGRAKSDLAAALFQDVHQGRVEITTSEAVLAEVAYVLSAPRHYRLPASDIVARLKPILELRGFTLPRKRVYLHALDIYANQPRLGFVDALTVAILEFAEHDLATFDRHFDRMPSITRYQPGAGGA